MNKPLHKSFGWLPSSRLKKEGCLGLEDMQETLVGAWLVVVRVSAAESDDALSKIMSLSSNHWH
jgi:hypothetical protein